MRSTRGRCAFASRSIRTTGLGATAINADFNYKFQEKHLSKKGFPREAPMVHIGCPCLVLAPGSEGSLQGRINWALSGCLNRGFTALARGRVSLSDSTISLSESNAHAISKSLALKIRYSYSDGPRGHCKWRLVPHVDHTSRQFHRTSSRSAMHATSAVHRGITLKTPPRALAMSCTRATA